MLFFVVSTVLYWVVFELDLACWRRQKLAVINHWVPRWSRFNLKFFGVQVERRGRYLDEGRLYPASESDPAGGSGEVGRIFIANHRSGLDIPILFTVAETHVISRHDLASWPLLGRTAKRIGTLFVDRKSQRSGAAVLREVDATLKRGEGVAMFPEGTAYDGDEVHEFRSGAFNAARRSGAEIIPIGIAYGNDTAYYAGLPFLKHMTRIACLNRLHVAVEVGEPLKLENGNVIDIKASARERVQDLVNRARQRLDS